MCIKKETKWQQFCRWCCVNKDRNSRFCFKTRTIYPTQSNDGTKDNMGTISVPSRTLCPTVEVANGDFFVFWQKETGAKRVAMETALRVSVCFFFDANLWCPSFKFTASIFPEISFIKYFPLFSCRQYDVITDLICIIEKRQYL